jgi:large subunit ribosomal protein L4
MELNIYKTDGTKSRKKVTLSDAIFAIEPNETLVYEDVRSFLSNKRHGNAKTKGRSEVRGGGRKAYRQKGTGNARRGTIRSPLLIGGGTVFGPKPRDYNVKLTKKMRQKARKSALTYKAQDEAIIVVEDFSFDEPKTKNVTAILEALKVSDKKALLLLPQKDINVLKSGRNIPNLKILEASKPSTYEIMEANYLLIQNSAISVLEESLGVKVEEEAA